MTLRDPNEISSRFYRSEMDDLKNKNVYFVSLSLSVLSAIVGSSVLLQDESRSMGGEVSIDMDSRANPLQLQLINEQVTPAPRH